MIFKKIFNYLYFTSIVWSGTALTPQELIGTSDAFELEGVEELRAEMISGQKGFIGLQTAVVVSPRQISQKSPLGEVYGYPFYQHWIVSSAYQSKNKSKAPLFGLTYSYYRKGWQQDDFLMLSGSGYGHLYRSQQYLGIYTASQAAGSWLFQMGWSRGEVSRAGFSDLAVEVDHSVYAGLRYDYLSIMTSFLDEINTVTIGLDLERRLVDAKAAITWKDYLPRLNYQYLVASKKQAISIEQNLYNKNWYVASSFDLNEKKWKTLRSEFFFDRTRLFSVGLSYTKYKEDWLWGAGLKLGVIEFAWNWSEDFESERYYPGTWRMGVRLFIGSLFKDHFRSKGAFVSGNSESLMEPSK